MLANYRDDALVHDHNLGILHEIRANRLGRRLRKGSDRHPFRRSAVVLAMALGAAFVAVMALAGVARQAEAATPEKVVFASNRVAGPGVNNPTRDYEIFKMNLDGSDARQLTFNKGDDYEPILSPDGTMVAYTHRNAQAAGGQGGFEIFVLNAKDGSITKNLTANGRGVDDYCPAFSPGGRRITYTSYGEQTSNPDGDNEVYLMSAVDGTGKNNLTDNGVEVSGAAGVQDYCPTFSPDGKKIAYMSQGEQTSNQEGDVEVYQLNSADGSGQANLTDNGADVSDYFPAFSPDGEWIAYESYGEQTSNLEGDGEVYRMNAPDGSGQVNLSNNALGVDDGRPVFSSGGERISYESSGKQPSNPQGDREVYRMGAQGGMGQVNLSNNGAGVSDYSADFFSAGRQIVYGSYGKQASNPEGDSEIYRMNTRDGKGKKNLTDNRGVDGNPADTEA